MAKQTEKPVKPEKTEKSEAEEKILEAAFDVVADNSISGTRMRLIAERTGMVQSNVHYYYKTKNDLMQALQKKVLSRFVGERQALLDKAGDSLEAKLEALTDQKKNLMQNEPRYEYVQTDFWLQAHIDPETQDHMCRSYRRWRQDVVDLFDEFAKNADPERKRLLASALMAMMDGASLQYLVDPECFDPDVFFDLCQRLIISGLKSKKP